MTEHGAPGHHMMQRTLRRGESLGHDADPGGTRWPPFMHMMPMLTQTRHRQTHQDITVYQRYKPLQLR
jgi:hypothetical protein